MKNQAEKEEQRREADESENEEIKESRPNESEWEPDHQNETEVRISMKPQFKRLKTEDVSEVPAMVSLEAKGGTRTSVDLVCVLDVSGSMKVDGKIDLLKDTITLLINGQHGQEYLTDLDRLSIITFSNKCKVLCELEKVTAESKKKLTELVGEIKAGGGTDIDGGMKLGLDILKERMGRRETTSILLLSDGVNEGAFDKFRKTIKSKQYSSLGNFSIHSFGLGSDHDEELMNSICQLRRGEYYFINQVSEISRAFCNVFGGLISMAMTDLTVQLRITSPQVQMGETFGVWEQKNERTYKLKIPQLSTGVRKNLMLKLRVPVHMQRESEEVCEVLYQGYRMDGSVVQDGCLMKLHYGSKENTHENIDVTENLLRVEAAKSIEKAIEEGDKGNFNEGRGILARMQGKIEESSQVREKKVGGVAEDLRKVMVKCKESVWEREGRKEAKNAAVAHMLQNNYQYSNPLQQALAARR